MKSIRTVLGLALLLGLLDRITKQFALVYFAQEYVVNSFLSLYLTFNPGISWGFLQEGYTFLVPILTSLVIVCLFIYTCWLYMQGKSIIAYVLILTGAVSNGIDRVLYGAVIDFIWFHWYSYSWPVFNVADVYVVGGVLWLFYQAVKSEIAV